MATRSGDMEQRSCAVELDGRHCHGATETWRNGLKIVSVPLCLCGPSKRKQFVASRVWEHFRPN